MPQTKFKLLFITINKKIKHYLHQLIGELKVLLLLLRIKDNVEVVGHMQPQNKLKVMLPWTLDFWESYQLNKLPLVLPTPHNVEEVVDVMEPQPKLLSNMWKLQVLPQNGKLLTDHISVLHPVVMMLFYQTINPFSLFKLKMMFNLEDILK